MSSPENRPSQNPNAEMVKWDTEAREERDLKELRDAIGSGQPIPADVVARGLAAYKGVYTREFTRRLMGEIGTLMQTEVLELAFDIAEQASEEVRPALEEMAIEAGDRAIWGWVTDEEEAQKARS